MSEFLINFFFSFLIGIGLATVILMFMESILLFIDSVKNFKKKWRKKDDE